VRVWVSRAEPGASATAGRLRALGHEPIVAPLLRVRFLDPEVDLAGVGAVAFTSRNGVEGFTRLVPWRGAPVFAVGDATAEAARAAGFTEVASADGDVVALTRLIAQTWAGVQPPSLVLHPSAAEPAGDLAGALAASGVKVRSLPVYETLAAEALPEAVAHAQPDAVLIHSPKAGRVAARLIDPARAAGMTAFALSPACAQPLRGCGFREIRSAEFPNEAALLKLLDP